MVKAFISYCHTNKDFANRIAKDLDACNTDIWIDIQGLDIGDSLPDKIEKSIEKSDFLIIILSKDSVKSKWVNKEIEIAYHYQQKNGKLVILPLLIEDCDIPQQIENIVYADFRDDANYEGQFRKILKAMDIILKKEIENQYTVFDVSDISYALAMRVMAKILVDKGLPRSHIERIIPIVNEDVKNQAYARNKMVAKRWNKKSAQIVAMFFYESIDDLQNANWICKTLWHDPKVDKQARMHKKFDKIIDSIEIKWSKIHGTMKELYRKNTLKKKEYIEAVRKYKHKLNQLLEEIREIVNNYEKTAISEEEYIKKMGTKLIEVEKLDEEISKMGLPPYECGRVDDLIQGSIILLHNVSLPFSDDGLVKWNKHRRDAIIDDNLGKCEEEIKNLKYEFDKVL
jgi:acetyl-CoA carboxylase beta subunit